MRVLTVAATKGGVGKSTISANLATAGAERGMRVLLVDCDPQKSSMGWRDIRENNDVVAMAITTPTIHKDLARFESAFDLAVIDCGGETHSLVMPSAMSAAAKNGVVIIPVLPSVYDVWATEDTLNLLRQVRGVVDVEARFLVNQVMPRRLMSQEVNEALEDSREEVIALANQLVFRESYKKSIKEGKGVVEYTDLKAREEMIAVFDELMGIIDSKERG